MRMTGMQQQWIIAVSSVLVATSAGAQGSMSAGELYPIGDKVRKARTVQVSPHRIILTPQTRSATLEFINGGDRPAEADVEIQFAYPQWPTGDTVLFSANWHNRRPRDTVVTDPPPSAPYAGRWLSGVPARVSLKPRETRRVTLRIDPPPGLRDGEYVARVVTIVRSNKNDDKKPKSKDAKASYKMPIIGVRPPDLRDSAEVYYRQGPMSTGVHAFSASAMIDSVNRPTPRTDFGPNQLWLLFQVRPAGTAHFEGQLRMYARSEETGRQYAYNPAFVFSLYGDGVMRFWAKTSFLPPGRYQMVVSFEEAEGGVDETGRVPVKATQISLPFRVKR